FEPKRLPVVALRRILSRVVLKKRASANSAERAAWAVNDLLFVSKGMPPSSAHDAAIRVIDGGVRLQAAVLSYCDTFIVVGLFVAVSLPLVLLLGRGKGKPAGEAH
ncbi:MAG TPA: hypothetical protein VGY48_17630, partial [Vicinamibacterales bacterium]|nr:hypothetical protein [Vicinamibacterales bacterium]